MKSILSSVARGAFYLGLFGVASGAWQGNASQVSGSLVLAVLGYVIAARLSGGRRQSQFARAAEAGDVDALTASVEGGTDPNDPKDTPLVWAAQRGHTEAVKALFKAGADPNIVGGEGLGGETALIAATTRVGTEIVPLVKLLLEAGADPNKAAGEPHGGTPAWWACELGRPAVLEVLLNAGATVDKSCLEIACAGLRGSASQNERRLQVVKLLLERGLDPSDGLHNATFAGHENIVTVLLHRLGPIRIRASWALLQRGGMST